VGGCLTGDVVGRLRAEDVQRSDQPEDPADEDQRGGHDLDQREAGFVAQP